MNNDLEIAGLDFSNELDDNDSDDTLIEFIHHITFGDMQGNRGEQFTYHLTPNTEYTEIEPTLIVDNPLIRLAQIQFGFEFELLPRENSVIAFFPSTMGVMDKLFFPVYCLELSKNKHSMALMGIKDNFLIFENCNVQDKNTTIQLKGCLSFSYVDINLHSDDSEY